MFPSRWAETLIACVALAGMSHVSEAALTTMNDTTRTNLLLVSGRPSGWGAVGWYQYNASGVSQGSKSLFAARCRPDPNQFGRSL